MYKTKLCILFNKTGDCSRPNCTFAHGNAELRRPGESSFTERQLLTGLVLFFIREWNLLVFLAAIYIGFLIGVESAGFFCGEIYLGFLIALESTFFMKKIYHGFCGVLILRQLWFSDSRDLVASNACYQDLSMPVVITSGIFILPVMYVEHVVFSVIIYIFNGLSSGFLDQEICSLWGFDCQYIKFGGF